MPAISWQLTQPTSKCVEKTRWTVWICCSRVQVFVVALRESGPLAHSIALQSAATSPHEAQVCSDQSLPLVKLPGGGELHEVERVRPGASASRVTHTSHAFASGWTHVRSLVGPTPSACQQQPSCWQPACQLILG